MRPKSDPNYFEFWRAVKLRKRKTFVSNIAGYGSWKSPITAELISSGSVGLSRPLIDSKGIYWLEMRPSEAGRNVVVRRNTSGQIADMNPPPFNARTRVHEYGGGDYIVCGDN